MLFLRGLVIIIFFQSFSCIPNPRCPPLTDLKDCKCENSKKAHILECRGGELPVLHNVYVDEIIIIKSLSDKIEFNFIQGPKIITLEDNDKLQITGIKAILTNELESIKLINNKDLNGDQNLKTILQQIPKVKSVHIENSAIDNLNIQFGLDNLKNLSYLLLPSNGIKNIDGYVFEGLNKLNILDLSHNKINSLKPSSLKIGSDQELEIFLNNNEINFENLIASKLKDNNLAPNKMTVHLDNNKIEKINNAFVDFVKNKIKIYFDGNEINCASYPKINNVLENQDSRNYLLGIYCKDYSNLNLFEISQFTDQSPTAPTVQMTLSTVAIKLGKLSLKIVKGKFNKKNSSYVAVCINDGVYEIPDTKNCKLCGISTNTSTDLHTDYKGECKLEDKTYNEETLLVFGAARVPDASLRPENVDGLAMITIGDALIKSNGTGKKFKLEFDSPGNQYIEVLINFP